ncbi:uncharacterized protein LOC121385347 [Gigantopelta aegis]|uniref:uncharacterized protein LOC121385347 n=1 Tax=Gigantopelta aegis TaxID=1735272 RepID=UPI001B887B0A|nr:uncharacterized protein LOC121385347 [Gigantopelta aegis]
MGNRQGANKNKKKDEKKKEKEVKKQKIKKKTKNRNSVTISERDSQIVFESSEDLALGACAAPGKNTGTKSQQVQPDVLAGITFDPATRPRDHSRHGAWSSDDESPTSTLGYSTPLLRTPKTQRSAHAAAKSGDLSTVEHLQEVAKSNEQALPQNISSSPGEVRLRHKSESLSPASSPGLSRDVKKKRALGQAIHENGSSKAIEAAILFAPPPVCQKQKGGQSPAKKGTPEINIFSDDQDSLEDALCPWLKDDDTSIDEEQLDEMFISCIDLSYSMADACSEKEFTGGSEADFSSLETRSKVKDRQEQRKKSAVAPSCYEAWEGSSVDPIRGTDNALRTSNTCPPRTSPMLKAHHTNKSEKTKCDTQQFSKVKEMGSSVDNGEHTPVASSSESSGGAPSETTKHTHKDGFETKTKDAQNATQEGIYNKGSEATKSSKKTGKSKDKKRKTSRSKNVPTPVHQLTEANSNKTKDNEKEYQGREEMDEPELAVSELRPMDDKVFKEESADQVSLLVAADTRQQRVDPVTDEPHRFIGDGQTPADFAESIMSSMSETPASFSAEPVPPSRDPQPPLPMSKLVQRITEFIREETSEVDESRRTPQKPPSHANEHGVRPQIISDTYSQELDDVFLSNNKSTSYVASFTDYSRASADLQNTFPCSANIDVGNKDHEHAHTEYKTSVCGYDDETSSPQRAHTQETSMCPSERQDESTESTYTEDLGSEQYRSTTYSDARGIYNDIPDQIGRNVVTEPAIREHACGQSDAVNSDDKCCHINQPKVCNPFPGETLDQLSSKLYSEKALPEASVVESHTSCPGANTCDKETSGDQPPEAALGSVVSSSSNSVPPPSPSAMDALEELDEDEETDGQTDVVNDQKSKEIQVFGDSVLKRLSYLVESQGNESNDEEENPSNSNKTSPQRNSSSDVILPEGESHSAEGPLTSVTFLEHSSHTRDSEMSGDLPVSKCDKDIKRSEQITNSKMDRDNPMSKENPSVQSDKDIKMTDKTIICMKTFEKPERVVEKLQSMSSITSTDTDSQNKESGNAQLSDDMSEQGAVKQAPERETFDKDKKAEANPSLGCDNKKDSSAKRKGKSKKAKARAKKAKAKANKSKSEQTVSTENISPKIVVKRPKIPDELTHTSCHNTKTTDVSTESNSDSNPKPPKRESQQITEVIDAYGDAVDPPVEVNQTKSLQQKSEQICPESTSNTLTKKIKVREDVPDTDHACKSEERTSSLDCADVGALKYHGVTDEHTACDVFEVQSSNTTKRPQGLALQRIIQDGEQTYKREPRASWELSDESDTTEESLENIDYPAGCQSSSSADSVFRIPDISETFGEMDSVKNILEDFEDRTPQAESVPYFIGKETLKSQPDYLSVHRRSRMSPALTNKTESDLDISEMRDDISTDSMYADDEGDGTLLFSKSYTEQTGSGVLMSCTFYNSGHNKEDSDDFWEECVDEAYHQIELSADAATATFQDARKQMHEIHEHLRTLRLQMETLQDDLENATITPEPEFRTESDDKRLVTD